MRLETTFQHLTFRLVFNFLKSMGVVKYTRQNIWKNEFDNYPFFETFYPVRVKRTTSKRLKATLKNMKNETSFSTH